MASQSRDVTVIASKSFDFMTKLVKDVGNLLLLIVLNVIPIVDFIVLGYYVRVVRNDPEEPPKLSDYSALFVEGLKLVLVLLIYVIIPLLIIILGVFMPALFAVPALAAIVFLVILLFLALPALGIYMRTGDFSKAFALGEAWSLVQSFGLGNYVLLFLLLAVFNLIATAIGFLIPWIGHAVVGVFSMAFTFKAISLFVNVKYPRAPPVPAS